MTDIVLDILEDFKYPHIEEFRREPYLCNDDFCVLWFWFVKLSSPELDWKQVTIEDSIPEINTGALNVQFGYGLYTM